MSFSKLPFKVRLATRIQRKILIIESNLARNDLSTESKHYWGKPTREKLTDELNKLKGVLGKLQ